MVNMAEEGAEDHRQALLDILPETGNDCCFLKEEFIDDNFSVDKFVKSHRSDCSLERLRELLSIYLKNVRFTLNDLINHDYADFVNLSTNLVGMDKSIAVLSGSLSGTKSELDHIISEFSDVSQRLHEKTSQLKDTQRVKKELEAMIDASERVDKLEALIDDPKQLESCDKDICLTALERMHIEIQEVSGALDAVKSDLPLLSNLQERIFKLSIVMSEKSKLIFIDAINARDKETIERMMKFHERNDNCKFLEAIVRTSIVKPKLDTIINEDFITSNGLDKTFDAIIHYADKECGFLESLGNDNYDFIRNSVWAEVIDRVRSSTVAGDFR